MSEVKKHYESANLDDPESIIEATQRSIIRSMRDVIADIKEETKAPGLTWAQLDYFFEKFGERKAEVIIAAPVNV